MDRLPEDASSRGSLGGEELLKELKEVKPKVASTSVMVAGGGDEGGKVKGRSDHPAAEGASGVDIPKPLVEEAAGFEAVALEDEDLEEADLEDTILTLLGEEDTTLGEEDTGVVEEDTIPTEAAKVEAEAAAEAQSAEAQDWDPLAVDISTFSSAFSGLQLQELEGVFQRPEYPDVIIEKEYEISDDDTEEENGSN